MKDQIRTEKSQTRVRRTFVFDFSIGTVQTQGNAVISAMVRFAIFSECGAKWSYRSTLGVWGWRGARSTLLLCSQPSATVRNRPRWGCYGRAPTQHSTVFTVFTLHILHSTPFHTPQFTVLREQGEKYKAVEIVCFTKVFYVTAFGFVGFSCFFLSPKSFWQTLLVMVAKSAYHCVLAATFQQIAKVILQCRNCGQTLRHSCHEHCHETHFCLAVLVRVVCD